MINPKFKVGDAVYMNEVVRKVEQSPCRLCNNTDYVKVLDFNNQESYERCPHFYEYHESYDPKHQEKPFFIIKDTSEDVIRGPFRITTYVYRQEETEVREVYYLVDPSSTKTGFSFIRATPQELFTKQEAEFLAKGNKDGESNDKA